MRELIKEELTLITGGTSLLSKDSKPNLTEFEKLLGYLIGGV